MLTFFNKTVLIVATIILIISLILLGISLLKSILNHKYPPIISDCPDYWDVSFNNGLNCINKNNINVGTLGSDTTIPNNKDNSDVKYFPPGYFKMPEIEGETNICKKYKWALDNDVVWDGITNNSQDCTSNYY